MTPTPDQYRAVKERHPAFVLLFRVGRDYEAFSEDAELLTRLFPGRLDTHDNFDAIKFPADLLDEIVAKLTHNGHYTATCTSAHFGFDWTVTRARMPGERKDGSRVDMIHEGQIKVELEQTRRVK